MLLVEIESSLGPAILAAARERFPLGRIEIRQDLAGLDRLLVVET
jgi:hypothetical protein